MLVIGALAGYIYMQKVETDKKIADLENEKTQIKEGIKDAAGFAAGVALGAITAGVDLLPKKDDGTERYLGDTQENKYFS